MEEFRPDLIKNYLNQLGSSNLMVFAESKQFEPECTLEEPIYKSKYTIVPLGDLAPLPCNVAFPEHNQFIPEDLSLLPLGTKLFPRKLYESKYIEAFFKEDHEFELPKAQIDLRLYFDGRNLVKEEVIRTLF